MAGSEDPLAIAMKKQFIDMGRELIEYWVDFWLPVGSDGRRQMMWHVELDDEQEWYLLEETYRKWLMWQAEEIEADSDIVAFDQNLDGAQDRLLELRQTFGDDPEETP